MCTIHQHHTPCSASTKTACLKRSGPYRSDGGYVASKNLLSSCSKAKVGKVHVNLDPIIGQHYGVQFELGQNGRDISVKRHKSDRYKIHEPLSAARRGSC